MPGGRGRRFWERVEEKRINKGWAEFQLRQPDPVLLGDGEPVPASVQTDSVIALHLLCRPFQHKPGPCLTSISSTCPKKDLRTKSLLELIFSSLLPRGGRAKAGICGSVSCSLHRLLPPSATAAPSAPSGV